MPSSTPIADTYLIQIWNDKVDEADVLCLQKAVAECYYGYTIQDVLRFVLEHKMQLWRGGCGNQRFIILTQILNHPGGKEFQVWSLAGKGYIKAVPVALPILLEFAKKYNCRWLTGYEQRNAFKRIYAMLKPDVLFRKWIMEIENVN